MYYFAAIMALAFLIVVHESGHYFVARWCGMRIERFSIGFGPGIFKIRSKKTGTTFQLAPIPFGGFVEIRGMNIAEEVDPDDRFAYPNRPTWQRFVTIFAGPATNYLSAIVLAFALYTCHGVNSAERWYGVLDVLDGYDATGKLQSGDRILAVDHTPVFASSGPTLTERVTAKAGAAVLLTVRRDGQELDVSIKPTVTFPKCPTCGDAWNGAIKMLHDKNPEFPDYLLGIAKEIQADVVSVGIIDSAGRALIYPIDKTKMIASSLYEIIRGKEQADPGGPTRMVKEFARAFHNGFVDGIELLMLLSVYLGLFNLFPLPALDGGRLVFLGYELVTRRRANPKIETMVHMGGIMLLGVVMILVTLRDFGAF